VNNGGGDGNGSFEVKVSTNTMTLADVRVPRFGLWNFFCESKVLIKDKTKIAS